MELLEEEFREIERQTRAAAMAEYEEDRRARFLRLYHVPHIPYTVWPLSTGSALL